MSSLNRAQLIGHLGRDPEVRVTQDNRKIVQLSIATSERWKDRSGQVQERTEWHRVVIFNEHFAGVAEQYLTKGSKCMVEGKLVTRKWSDQSGQDRYSTEIQLGPYNSQLILLDGRSGGDAGAPASGAPSASRPKPGGGPRPMADLDDEIPF